MSRLTRRGFLGGAAAAACVGCDGSSSDDPQATPQRTSAASADEPAADASGSATTVRRDDLPFLTLRHAVGQLDEVRASVADAPLYVPEARAYLVAVEPDAASALADAVDASLSPGLDHGLLALYQKCPHLGCRVPFCETSGWFECFCHGTMFTSLGEHRSGPGPRGLDAFAVAVDDGVVSIDTGQVVMGLALGTVVVDSSPAGPHCVTSAGDH